MVANATYEWTVGADLRSFVGADLTHHSATNASLGNDPELRLRPTPRSICVQACGQPTMAGR
jgi:hypothetical protein